MSLSRKCEQCGTTAAVVDDKDVPADWVHMVQADGQRVDFCCLYHMGTWGSQFPEPADG